MSSRILIFLNTVILFIVYRVICRNACQSVLKGSGGIRSATGYQT